MIERDNRDIQFTHLAMENVRLTNENASLKDYISFLENELKSIESEHAEELALKDKASGEDVWTVVLLHYQGPKTLRTEQEIGRFNVPKNDPMCSKHPQSIISGCTKS